MPKAETVLSDEDEVLAGELALGVLEGQDLTAAQRRLIAEPAFACEVGRWRDHFAVAALRGPTIAPSKETEKRVQRAVQAESGKLVIPFQRRALMRWRKAALILGAVAAGLAILILRPMEHVVTGPAGPSGSVLVAAMDVPATHAAVLAKVESGHLRVTGGIEVPYQRDAQAWIIESSGKPLSLGVLRRVAGQALETTPQQVLAPGQTLAISIEPVGGAPGPVPTGPVVATGKIQTI